jgi:hypothetical protein
MPWKLNKRKVYCMGMWVMRVLGGREGHEESDMSHESKDGPSPALVIKFEMSMKCKSRR